MFQIMMKHGYLAEGRSSEAVLRDEIGEDRGDES